MREWPESRELLAVLARAGRLRRARAILSAIALGLVIAAPISAALVLSGRPWTWSAGAAVFATLAVMTVAHFRFNRSLEAVAGEIETAAPDCRNLVVTAEALLRSAGPTPAHICRVVVADAAAVAKRLDVSAMMPLRPTVVRAAGAAVLLASTFLLAAPVVERLLPSFATEASSAPVLSDVRVTVTAPEYSGLAPASYDNPERVTALVGSRISVVAEGPAASVTMATTSASQVVSKAADGTFTHAFTLEGDGFVALTPADNAGETGVRRLIGLSATPDRPPAPRVTAPGKDMFLREATATFDIIVEATDDFGLRSLKLAYTKVAGVGESFTFTEGETPITIERASSKQWTGKGQLSLQALKLEVGDMVVYRAVATDTRPGSSPVESDSFIIEIVSASEAMAEGFSIDDTRDKYAISQQMVILKTERLIGRVASRTPPDEDTVYEEALTIAAEQRSVRAEIVFMMGGHFEDEFVEAAHEHEIADGRMDNSGRADLGRAVRDMARAATELVDGNLKAALAAEKLALEAMQRALSRRRFILRTLTQRESIDDARRLTGKLGDARPGRRSANEAAIPAEVTALRAALATVTDLQAQSTWQTSDTQRLSTASEALLQTSPSDRAIVDIVTAMSGAGEAFVADKPADARRLMADAASKIAARLRSAAVQSGLGESAETRRLRGALGDVGRIGGGRD